MISAGNLAFMQILHFKATWGVPGTLDQQIEKIKAAGYDGFEEWVKPHYEIRPLIVKHDVRFIGIVSGDNPEQFKRDLGELVDSGAMQATVHCGSSAMGFQQGMDHLGKLVEVTKQVSIPVNFETHRGRLLYEPNSTYEYLKALPDLYLCADFSHWCCVTESMLGGFKDQLELAIQRTRHIHTRVGFEEGPQVPDPRVKQWEGYVTTFEAIWDRIKAVHEKRNARYMTVDPEFGPPNYQWTDPKTGQPLADIWEVSQWLTDRLRARWKAS